MKRVRWFRRIAYLVGAVVLATTLTALQANPTAAKVKDGFVYTMSNAAQGNSVLAFRVSGSGLTPVGAFATGGSGTGPQPVASQGSVAVALHPARLVAVNAGSNNVSAFAIREDGTLRLLNTAPTLVGPISVAVRGRLVYVLNSADQNGGGNWVSGFQLGDQGLTPIPGALKPLSGGAQAPAAVAFTADGGRLVVTEAGSSTIDTFAVRSDGTLGQPIATTSNAVGPFGFDSDEDGHLVVSDAVSPEGASSYAVRSDGTLRPISLVPSAQGAPCWVKVDRRTNLAYVANKAAGTISTYAINGRGELSLRAAVAAAVGGFPGDETIWGRQFFVIDVSGRIVEADIQHAGVLGAPREAATGLPFGTSGLASISTD
jgi:6-phosphogluconolactonase